MDFKYLVNDQGGEDTGTGEGNFSVNGTVRETFKKLFIILTVASLVVVALFVAAFVLIGNAQNSTNDVMETKTPNLLQIFLNMSNDMRTDFNQSFQILKKFLPTGNRNALIFQGWHKASETLLYKKFETLVTYTTARSKCRDIGGRLIAEALRSASVVRNLRQSGLVTASRNYHPWIGYDDIKAEGNWTWADGGETNPNTTQWDYNPPSVKEPNGGRAENCGHLRVVKNGVAYINDISCDLAVPYICEKTFPQ